MPSNSGGDWGDSDYWSWDNIGNIFGDATGAITDNADWLLPLIAGGAGYSGAFDAETTPTGYQGGIPRYTAVRDQADNFTNTDEVRVPGAYGQRYFSDTQFTPYENLNRPDTYQEGVDTAQGQAQGIEAINAGRMQELAPLLEFLNMLANKNAYNPSSPPPSSGGGGAPVTPAVQPGGSTLDTVKDMFGKEPTLSLGGAPSGSNMTVPSGQPNNYVPQYFGDPAAQRTDYSDPSGLSDQELYDLLLYGPNQATKEERSATIAAAKQEQQARNPTVVPTGHGMSSTGGQRTGGITITQNPTGVPTGNGMASNGYQYAAGGLASLPQAGGKFLSGPHDGMADTRPATIEGQQPAALSDGEFVVPADVVSHLGNGNTNAGASQLENFMSQIRQERTGNPRQGKPIDTQRILSRLNGMVGK